MGVDLTLGVQNWLLMFWKLKLSKSRAMPQRIARWSKNCMTNWCKCLSEYHRQIYAVQSYKQLTNQGRRDGEDLSKEQAMCSLLCKGKGGVRRQQAASSTCSLSSSTATWWRAAHVCHRDEVGLGGKDGRSGGNGSRIVGTGRRWRGTAEDRGWRPTAWVAASVGEEIRDILATRESKGKTIWSNEWVGNANNGSVVNGKAAGSRWKHLKTCFPIFAC
jgi:hypothetical protein